MERSVGLYLAVSPTESDASQALSWPLTAPLTGSPMTDWRQLSGRAYVPLLATLVGLAILGATPAAMAALQRGDRSAAVATLQNQLHQLGFFDGPVTGYYGPLTQSAVLRLQQQNQLTADGVVGADTQGLLDRLKVARSTLAPAVPVANNNGLLQRGSQGEAVVKLQQQLTRLGYAVPSTGYFGAMTEAAVVQLQRDRGLKPDALVGTLTAAALASAPPASRPVAGNLRQGNRGATVVALQQRLAKLGYFTGTATGYFGPITQTAVLNFQQDHRLQVDGLVGSNTLTALGMTDVKVSAVQ